MDYVIDGTKPTYLSGKLELKITGKVYTFDDFSDSNYSNGIWDCQDEDYEVQLRMNTNPYNIIMVSVLRGDGEQIPYDVINDSLTIYEDIYRHERKTDLFGNK